jgi:hypothetical protein
LAVVDKMSTGLDELLHTDIRMKASAVNAPEVDFGELFGGCLAGYLS